MRQQIISLKLITLKKQGPSFIYENFKYRSIGSC